MKARALGRAAQVPETLLVDRPTAAAADRVMKERHDPQHHLNNNREGRVKGKGKLAMLLRKGEQQPHHHRRRNKELEG